MQPRRFVNRLLLMTLALGPGAITASADSASASLVVGVTVVRSCAINASPAGRGLATVELKCTPGAAAGLQTQRSTPLSTTPFRGVQSNGDVQVVTLNF